MTDFTKLRAMLEADRIEALEFLARVTKGGFGTAAQQACESLVRIQTAIQALDAVEQGERPGGFTKARMAADEVRA